MKESFEKYMAACPAVAILRGITTPEVPAVCDVLFEAGIRLLEIPLNSPNAVESIAAAVRHCAGRQMVGAGTVLTPEDVIAVYKAGGQFIISPNADSDVIRETKRLGMLSIPGFFTATEGFAAIQAGADYLKLFPAVLGPGYVKDLKAVIKTPIMAVGGVNAGNIPEFMKVCCGVGIGSALYKAGKSLEEIKKDAIAICEAVKQ
jgi:2-dehydro-3-deoxyphosphogalactonate aldolase